MSEVAGRMSIQEGARFLEKPQGGRGVLLGGVPGVKPAKVLVLGAGVVGRNAALMAAVNLYYHPCRGINIFYGGEYGSSCRDIFFVGKTASFSGGVLNEYFVSVCDKFFHSRPCGEDVYATAGMIIKVKEPIKPEYPLIRKDQVVFTYFHFACDRELTEAMMASGAVCIAYETVVSGGEERFYIAGHDFSAMA